ncbi:hypothetical protein GMORB2_5064 [Geosmithia morbida]|uniref:Nonsense-mediated mRNA decay factor n=1 Tax=Geosmithia morbida TaxID=1094350 RepID=A0A9P5D1X1_9HYPO|nr:uncharacterized protein GMORB2_5064 [Geosmithia morbida]KAF4124398.1 hypothetical protein GMORB2_5064 [Geosmithia morbida]
MGSVNLDKGWIPHLSQMHQGKGAQPNREGSQGGGRDQVREQDGQEGAIDDEDRIFQCGFCNRPVTYDIDTFTAHVQADLPNHGTLEDETAIAEAFARVSLRSPVRSRQQPQSPSGKKRPGPDPGGHGRCEWDPDRATGEPEPKRLRSPVTSDRADHGDHGPPAAKFDRGRGHNHSHSRGSHSVWQLDDPYAGGSGQRPAENHGRNASSTDQPRRRQGAARPTDAGARATTPADAQAHGDELLRPNTSMRAQPESRPITQDQLVKELKGIYSTLVVVETKCIEVDAAQTGNIEHNPSAEQWKALILLHRTLLHEHHDFFLACQHPVGSEALRRLPYKYSIPARMWRHGIHSFLEILRQRLPASYDQMLAFIYIAYGMMSLLYETVPAFEDTWRECLGDLARYRMAIEEHDLRDREVWTGVARSWYSLASDKGPSTGRLYHHLAILARPNAVQQLYFYVKSLCVPIPFASARESIMTLFDPLLAGNPQKLQPVDAAFVRVHAILFSGKHEDQLESSMKEYIEGVDGQIGQMASRWLGTGYHMGIPLACALLEYGNRDNFLMELIRQRHEPKEDKTIAAAPKEAGERDGGGEEGEASNGVSGQDTKSVSTREPGPNDTFIKARSLLVKAYTTIVSRWGDYNTLPFLHTILAFLDHASQYPEAMRHIEEEFPWHLTAVMLNYILPKPVGNVDGDGDDNGDGDGGGGGGGDDGNNVWEKGKKTSKTKKMKGKGANALDAQAHNAHVAHVRQRIDDTATFPGPYKGETPRPLPEDFAMRGLVYTEDYYPIYWFRDSRVEEEEKFFEMTSMMETRKERILWLGRRLANHKRWLTWDGEGHGRFDVVDKYAERPEGRDRSDQSEVASEKTMWKGKEADVRGSVVKIEEV